MGPPKELANSPTMGGCTNLQLLLQMTNSTSPVVLSIEPTGAPGKYLFLCVAADLDAARNSIDKALATMGKQASPDMFTIPSFPVARRVDGPRMTDSFKAHAAHRRTKYQISKPDDSEAPKPSGNAR